MGCMGAVHDFTTRPFFSFFIQHGPEDVSRPRTVVQVLALHGRSSVLCTK